jgi:hypothetical protein
VVIVIELPSSEGDFTMKRAFLQLLAIVLVGLSASDAFSLGANHSAGRPKEGDRRDWPEGLARLANDAHRVQGYWVNANDFFDFHGDGTQR